MKIEHKYLIALIIVAALVLAGTFIYAVAFDTFGYGLLKAAIGVILFYLSERYLMHEIVGTDAIKQGNVAYALLQLGVAIIIASAVATG